MSVQYDQYLAEHRKNVEKAFWWIADNLPELQVIENCCWNAVFTHDQSKNEPDEYEAYDAYFYGNKHTPEIIENYQKAWLLHIHRNPHHWQYWVLIHDDNENGELETALKIPYEYIIEMICDWWSFSWKNGNLYEVFDWYEKNLKYIKLEKKTRAFVESILNMMKSKLKEMEDDKL